MVGSNVLTLNEATMILALQHYFQTVLFSAGNAPIVNSVKAHDGYSTTFTVELLSEKK